MTRQTTETVIGLPAAERVMASHLAALRDRSYEAQCLNRGTIRRFLAYCRDTREQPADRLLIDRPQLVRWLTRACAGVAVAYARQRLSVLANFSRALARAGVTATDVMGELKADRGGAGWKRIVLALRSGDPDTALATLRPATPCPGPLSATIGPYAELRRSLGLKGDDIDLLKQERYRWAPVRRVEIPKANGKTRPLGIPTWSDKLVQEAVRSLLEAYYEPRFSPHSHGFRPGRGCHSALHEVQKKWHGTVWFIEGDIKGCFDNIDHGVLLEILARDIRDGRLLNLLGDLLKAGYMEDWRYCDSLSGTPQGGIVSPLLANVYLNDLDKFVTDTLIPAYTRGERRAPNTEYVRLTSRLRTARRRRDLDEVRRLKREERTLMSVSPVDPEFRRLRYVRYADDFLLGFIGPKSEAEEIRQRLGEWLETNLKLTLSVEKTLVTHAADEKATFLGHEITVTKAETYRAENGKRAANGSVALLMPRSVVQKYRSRFSRRGKVVHRCDLLQESDYTIVAKYQAVLRGVYNFYCMATNVGSGRRMGCVKWVLETSLTKTLANKRKTRVAKIYRAHRGVSGLGLKELRVIAKRPGKTPLVATFGGFPLRRVPGSLGVRDFRFESGWLPPSNRRSEVVQRLLAGKCELCGAEVPVQAHHVRKLADLDRPGRRPQANWEKVMAARRRKSLMVCTTCHQMIHDGSYDGPSLRSD